MPHRTALLIDVLPVIRTRTFFRSASESREPEKNEMLVMGILDNFRSATSREIESSISNL